MKIPNLKEGDYAMKEKFIENGIEYVRNGDYYIPNLTVPDEKVYKICKYGRMHAKFIKENRPCFYSIKMIDGIWLASLKGIDTSAKETVDKLIKRVNLAFTDQEVVCCFGLCAVTQAIRISARVGKNLNYLFAVKLVLTCQERETIIAAICIRKCNDGIIHAKPSQNTEHLLRNRYTAVLRALVKYNLIYVYVALVGITQLLNRCEDRILKVHVVLVRSEVRKQKLVNDIQKVIDVVFLFQ